MYNVALWLGIAVAIVFSLLVFVTGKGDAMSGGGSIRTTFKGKASFEDVVSRWTLYLGIGFMALMLVVDVIGNNVAKSSPAPAPPVPAPTPGGTTGSNP